MKKIRYNILAYTWVWNEETKEKEKKECLAEIEAPYTEENYQKAITEAYNGEYTIEDDGQPEIYQPTESERIEALESALLELMGVEL